MYKIEISIYDTPKLKGAINLARDTWKITFLKLVLSKNTLTEEN